MRFVGIDPGVSAIHRLERFKWDLQGVGKYSELGTLVRMALSALRVDPHHALGAFPVHIDTSQGWVLRRLELPDKRGVIEYSIEGEELIVVLYRVRWR
jgi:hypothetical protein